MRHHTARPHYATNTDRQGHTASLKPRWKCAAQCWHQREFTACKSKRLFYYASHEWEWCRPLLSLSLPLSPCLHQLHIQRSAAQQYILPMQNSNYSSLLGWDHAPKMNPTIHDGWMCCVSDDSWRFREPKREKQRYFKLCCWAYHKVLGNRCTLDLLLCCTCCDHPWFEI